jgi:hypothetical protein
VVQMMPARIAILGRGGEGYADLPLPPEEGSAMVIVEQAASAGDAVILSLMTPIMGEGGMSTVRSLLSLSGDGEVRAVLKKTSEESQGGQLSLGGDEGENWFRDWQLGADGRVYAAPFYEGYKVFVMGLDGAVERVVEMEYAHQKRSKEEIAEMEERNANMPSRGGARMQFDINPYSRDIDSFYTLADGGLWVLSSKGVADCPEGSIGAFDVFDSRGRYQRRLTLDVDYDGRYDDFRIEGDRLFVLKEANAGPGLTSSMSTGGGHMVMMMAGGSGSGDDDEEEREAKPLEIICYELDI